MSHDSKGVIYYPNQRAEASLLKTFLVVLGNIVEGRELIWQMFKRDFFVVYRRSILGYFWILAGPVTGIITWVFMNYAGILHPGEVGMPYPVFVLLGSQMWGLFIGFYKSAAESLGSGSGLMKQIKFEHEVLLVKQAGLVVANFFITLAVVFLVMVIFRVVPPWQAVFFPVVILPLFFLGAAMGIVVSVFASVISDTARIVGEFIGFLMYITPVIYTTDFRHPLLKLLVKWNPLSYLIAASRDILTVGSIQQFNGYLVVSALTIVLFLTALRLFYVSEPLVAEKI
ncbi:ABC transporter permease [Candidatus Poribacteria bacterium]|nr:ABC transporter permease [Candidatus Poribacteria bacterium]